MDIVYFIIAVALVIFLWATIKAYALLILAAVVIYLIVTRRNRPPRL